MSTSNSNRIEEYKILINIYYEELRVLYTKITVFITIQVAILAGVITGYEKVTTYKPLFILGIVFLLLLTISQIIISLRGNTVNNAIINTIQDFESNTEFNLLEKFSENVEKIDKFKKMNLPSLVFTFVGVLFLCTWITLLFIFLLENKYINIDTIHDLLNTEKLTHNYFFCIFISSIYAITMKIADLLNEHGLKLFKYANIIFGVLCGIFGCILINIDLVIANGIMAMIMAFVIRKRIDYNNHIIAFIILSTYFFYHSEIVFSIYIFFLFFSIVLGSIKDLKYNQSKTKVSKIIECIYLIVPIIYAIPSLIYSIFSSNWAVFVVFFTYDFIYNITRLVGDKKARYTLSNISSYLK